MVIGSFDLIGADDLLERMLEPNVADTRGEPFLLLDLEDLQSLSGSILASIAAWVARQSLPVLGWSKQWVPGEVCELADVWVHDVDQLDAVSTAITRYPHAAMVLIQVLRSSLKLDIPSALAVESLGYATLLGGREFAVWLEARDTKHARSKAPDTPPLKIDRQGDRLHVELNHPENRNALSASMRDGLTEVFKLVMLDTGIAAVQVSGAGPSFCAGGDLGEFGLQRDLTEGHCIRSVRMPAQYLAACRDRVRIRVHGACIGAGIELSAFAAHITAARDTFFQLPEVAMGLIPGAGGCVSIPRRIGRQRAAFMALSGKDIDVETALAWGLIDAIR